MLFLPISPLETQQLALLEVNNKCNYLISSCTAMKAGGGPSRDSRVHIGTIKTTHSPLK